MRIFWLALSLVVGFIGIYLGLHAFKRFRAITQRQIPIQGLVVNAFSAGVATTLIFFGLILIMGFLDKTYVWNISSLRGAVIVALIPGSIVTVGSFVQSLIVARYRGILLDTLREKDKEE